MSSEFANAQIIFESYFIDKVPAVTCVSIIETGVDEGQAYDVSLDNMNALGLSGYPGKKLPLNPSPTTMSVSGGNLEASPI